jgi:hypothetical protein
MPEVAFHPHFGTEKAIFWIFLCVDNYELAEDDSRIIFVIKLAKNT